MNPQNNKFYLTIVKRHVGLLAAYIVCVFVLNAVILKGNDCIADAIDSISSLTAADFSRLALSMVFYIAAGTVAAYLKGVCGGDFGAGMQKDIRETLSRHLTGLSVAYFKDNGTGGLLAKFASDVSEAGRFFSEIIPAFIVNLITVIMVSVYIAGMDYRLILLLFASYPIMLVVADRLSRRLASVARRRRISIDERTQMANDILQGITVHRAYNLQDVMDKRIGAVIDEIAKWGCKSTRITSIGWAAKGIITTFPVLVCYLFALRETLNGQITAGDMLVFIVLLNRMLSPLGEVVFCANDMREAGVSLSRLKQIYDEKTEDDCSKTVKAPDKLDESRPIIEWRHVSFSYVEARNVIDDADFKIYPNERIGIVGGSGEGKSTIFNILCAFYPCKSGEYYLYGSKSTEWDMDALRGCFSLVSQDIFLYPMTIWENIALGRANASRADVLRACGELGFGKFIEALPQGYDTFVGERGNTLSGGQKQRISIARAILKDAPILLLDEPTSALDSETERNLGEAIERLSKDKTVLIIAHRLTTIENADRVFVLENGKLSEKEGGVDE